MLLVVKLFPTLGLKHVININSQKRFTGLYDARFYAGMACKGVFFFSITFNGQ